MRLNPTDPLRVAAIDFLNPAPLMWDFTHPPRQEELMQRYTLRHMTPSRCAASLALPADHPDACDIGLVPIAAYADTPDLAILPGCTVAAKGAIRSLLLIHRAAGTRDLIRTVAADTSSRATFAYVQIIFKHFWRQPVTFAPFAPNLDRMLENCDAAILIGDPALIALEEQAAREQRTGERLEYLDLGALWQDLTGHAWVSAVWAARASAIPSETARRLVRQDFLDSRDHGLEHREDLVKAWIPQIAIPAETIRTYLTRNIHYVLDDDCIAGIEFFFDLAAKYEVLPKAPPLNFL